MDYFQDFKTIFPSWIIPTASLTTVAMAAKPSGEGAFTRARAYGGLDLERLSFKKNMNYLKSSVN